MFSQHPVDQLIRELIRAGRAASADEVSRILNRMATAPFDSAIVRVRPALRGVSYHGQVLGDRAAALTYHLVQRVAADEQWAHGTVSGEYLDDLRRAVRHRPSQLAVYRRRGGPISVTVTPTAMIVPPERRGQGFLPNLLVAYSADRGIILTGYQCSTLENTGVPQEALWLK